jgi:hypothetical protein
LIYRHPSTNGCIHWLSIPPAHVMGCAVAPCEPFLVATISTAGVCNCHTANVTEHTKTVVF